MMTVMTMMMTTVPKASRGYDRARKMVVVMMMMMLRDRMRGITEIRLQGLLFLPEYAGRACHLYVPTSECTSGVPAFCLHDDQLLDSVLLTHCRSEASVDLGCGPYASTVPRVWA